MNIEVDVSPTDGGIVKVDGDAPYSYPDQFEVEFGDRLRIEAMAEDGYHFTHWSGEPIGEDNPVEVRAIRSMSITANFAPDTREFSSEDQIFKVIIRPEVAALDQEGKPLAILELSIDDTAPPPDEGVIIGEVYELKPYGTTFDPPAILIGNYDPSAIPFGIAAEDLMVMSYDDETGQWVELESAHDLTNGIIAALVENSATFAIVATPSQQAPASFTLSSLRVNPSEVNVGETVLITVLAANTGELEGDYTVTLKIDESIEKTKEVNLAGGASETVTFAVSWDEAGTHLIEIDNLHGSFIAKEVSSPPTTSPAATPPMIQSGWWLITIILAAVVVAIVVPLTRRRRMSEQANKKQENTNEKAG